MVSVYRAEYDRLCEEAARAGGVIKLSRLGDDGWGLQLLIAPARDGAGWRAAGVVFPDLSELDRHAVHLRQWARAMMRAGA